MILVIWKCESAAVVLKPAGLSTQAPAPHESLETQLRAQFANETSYIAFPHRLDRPVGGLILVAFTKRAARLLGEQFEAQRVSKSYVALVDGSVAEEAATWTDYLQKVEDEARVIVVSQEEASGNTQSKLAILEMRVLEKLGERTLIELRPKTGRMHQIRVQLASRGYPIIGDTLYGGQSNNNDLAEGTIALHAATLEFNDPINARRIKVESPFPLASFLKPTSSPSS